MRRCIEAIMPWHDDNLDKYQLQCPICGEICRRDFWSITHIDVEQIYYCTCGNILIVPPQEAGEEERLTES